ncbi:MAG TPA: hypothetical protein ENK57_26585, partial [Polyangiaceae bacterium]|nr:hypothetical protein [Polyangiaceae bacterium]
MIEAESVEHLLEYDRFQVGLRVNDLINRDVDVLSFELRKLLQEVAFSAEPVELRVVGKLAPEERGIQV